MAPGPSGRLWAIVLAGGDGQRVSALTATAGGTPIPKQYCSFGGTEPLLRLALERAKRIAAPEHIVVVVAHQHGHFWKKELSDLPEENVLAQPRNRGTAAGVLLPLLHILRRDPRATVLVLPSDHYVADEEVLRESAICAIQAARRGGDHLVLLGFVPQGFDPEYGWIVSAASAEPTVRDVASFVEKPTSEMAARLVRGGALLNGFIFAASAGLLRSVLERALPDLFARLADALRQNTRRALEQAYQEIENTDFSRAVLERLTECLRVVPVPPCGWSDLGTPARIKLFQNQLRLREPRGSRARRLSVATLAAAPAR